jgi:hypothetical protein
VSEKWYAYVFSNPAYGLPPFDDWVPNPREGFDAVLPLDPPVRMGGKAATSLPGVTRLATWPTGCVACHSTPGCHSIGYMAHWLCDVSLHSRVSLDLVTWTTMAVILVI